MNKSDESVETILKRLRKTAKIVAMIYSSQNENDLETFIQKHIVEVLPYHMKKFIYVVDIIADMARAEIMGIQLSEEQTKNHSLIVKEHMEELTQEVGFPLPKELEKFRSYGFPVILKTAQFRQDSRQMVALWKREGGDMEEFLKHHTRCQCGECDAFDKSGDIFAEVLAEMFHITLSGRKATDAEVERWLTKVAEGIAYIDRQKLIKNITLN